MDVGQLAGRGPGRGVAGPVAFIPAGAGQHHGGPVARVPVWAWPLWRQRATLSRAGSAVTLEVPRPGAPLLMGSIFSEYD